MGLCELSDRFVELQVDLLVRPYHVVPKSKLSGGLAEINRGLELRAPELCPVHPRLFGFVLAIPILVFLIKEADFMATWVAMPRIT